MFCRSSDQRVTMALYSEEAVNKQVGHWICICKQTFCSYPTKKNEFELQIFLIYSLCLFCINAKHLAVKTERLKVLNVQNLASPYPKW